ncbi:MULTISPECIES: antitoxin [Nocardia]|uniref:Antitoxin n=1 Tax=Nocardia flavorosea TaxID=53429 RepID=A0A846YRK6_9NOCA|nr:MULTISPECIES: antitoxin [Nocardia]NKY60134.1 antitoxin [Nocardia flavorosea]
MSLMDNLKNLAGKGQEAAAKNSDKINQAVDKAGDFLDQRTKGKYSDKIQKGKEAARKVVPPDQPGGPGQPGEPGPGPRP